MIGITDQRAIAILQRQVERARNVNPPIGFVTIGKRAAHRHKVGIGGQRGGQHVIEIVGHRVVFPAAIGIAIGGPGNIGGGLQGGGGGKGKGSGLAIHSGFGQRQITALLFTGHQQGRGDVGGKLGQNGAQLGHHDLDIFVAMRIGEGGDIG